MDPSRVRAVWAILRLRHPLLAASVVMHEYTDIRFVYVPCVIHRIFISTSILIVSRYKAPGSSHDLLKDAEANLEYQTQGKDGMTILFIWGV